MKLSSYIFGIKQYDVSKRTKDKIFDLNLLIMHYFTLSKNVN